MKNIKFFYIIASNKNEAEKIATKLGIISASSGDLVIRHC